MSQRESFHAAHGFVIAAFPATGKTILSQRSDGHVVDSDSSNYAWSYYQAGPDIDRDRHPDWPDNYLAKIKSDLKNGHLVLVSTHEEVRTALVKHGIYFVLVYPRRDLRAEYRRRMTARGSPEPLIEKVIVELWDDALDQLEAQEGCDRVVLGPGRYLSDVFG